MTRQSTKFKGQRALRLLLYQNPDGVRTEDIVRELDIHRATAWRWLVELGATNNDLYGTWMLRPSADEIEYARAVLTCIE
jgi:DNA-binding IclR family transcriptional regulator